MCGKGRHNDRWMDGHTGCKYIAPSYSPPTPRGVLDLKCNINPFITYLVYHTCDLSGIFFGVKYRRFREVHYLALRKYGIWFRNLLSAMIVLRALCGALPLLIHFSSLSLVSGPCEHFVIMAPLSTVHSCSSVT